MRKGLRDATSGVRCCSTEERLCAAISAAVDVEIFRPALAPALAYADGAKGGRPPLDPVMMLKILVIQAANNLSDERAEYLINDRLSFTRFLGLGLDDRGPDAHRLEGVRHRMKKLLVRRS